MWYLHQMCGLEHGCFHITLVAPAEMWEKCISHSRWALELPDVIKIRWVFFWRRRGGRQEESDLRLSGCFLQNKEHFQSHVLSLRELWFPSKLCIFFFYIQKILIKMSPTKTSGLFCWIRAALMQNTKWINRMKINVRVKCIEKSQKIILQSSKRKSFTARRSRNSLFNI